MAVKSYRRAKRWDTKRDFEERLLWQACDVWSCEWLVLLGKETAFNNWDETQTIRTNEPYFIVVLWMDVCYLLKVTPGVKLMEKPHS